MTATNSTLASNDLQVKRKNYPQYSGEKLKGILAPKIDPMPCIKADELELLNGRLLMVKDGNIIDVTDPVCPQTVHVDEVYYVGWTKGILYFILMSSILVGDIFL